MNELFERIKSYANAHPISYLICRTDGTHEEHLMIKISEVERIINEFNEEKRNELQN